MQYVGQCEMPDFRLRMSSISSGARWTQCARIVLWRKRPWCQDRLHEARRWCTGDSLGGGRRDAAVPDERDELAGVRKT
jgi:hypothetical protein